MCASAQTATPRLIRKGRLSYNHRMPRLTSLGLFLLSALAVACASTPNQSPDDDGTLSPAPCEVDGYPCSPAEQSDSAIELSERYKGDIQSKRVEGQTYTEIAEWLRGQEGVVDVVAAEDRLRFRVEGGSAHWLVATGRDYPVMPAPTFSEGSEPNALPTSATGSFASKRVLREDGSDTKIKKKALIVNPFGFQFGTSTDSWRQRLRALHDYESVEYFEDDQIPDQYFANWNDYRFVWVLSHGAYLPDRDDPDYTAIFSAKQCGINRWIGVETVAGRGGEPIKNGKTIAWLMGLDRPQAEAQLTDAQLQRWRAFRDNETRELEQKGQGCGQLDIGSVSVPGQGPDGGPLVRQGAFLDFIYYDEAWYSTHFPSGLDNVLVHLSVCSSLAVPIRGSSASPSVVFGWTEPVGAEQDDLATAVLFDRLITHGETASEAYRRLVLSGNHSHMWDGKTTELKDSTWGGGEHARIRETVTIIDPFVGEPFPDGGAMLDAREITADGNTIVDVTVEIVGFGELDGDELDGYKLRFYDGAGQAISQELDVDQPRDGRTVMTVPVSFDQEVRTPTELEIEARVTLAEDPGAADSRHRIKLTVGPAIESLWFLNVGGGGSARGDLVLAPFPRAIVDGEGRTVWQVQLGQLGDNYVPNATLLIVGHDGRNMDCTGEIGTFPALTTVIFTASTMPTEGFGGGLGEGECGDSVDVEIESFSKQDDLVANVSGTICHWRRVGDEVVVDPVPINGRFQMPAAGCGADPGGDLVGSYYASEAPSLCFDIYPNAAIAPAFDETCALGAGLVCSDDPCPTAGQIGQCDYTDDSVQITFRGQVTHFLPGGDWPSPSDLQAACEIQLGVWTTGEPPAAP